MTTVAALRTSYLGVVKGMTGGVGFWHNKIGQALINNFVPTATGLTLANWLATTFPNLYGAGAGANDLTGESNARVAAFFEGLFKVHDGKAQAQVLPTALGVYATTAALGGTTPGVTAAGFTVSATGLGARSFTVSAGGGPPPACQGRPP
jgi:hypothetical protein